MALKLVEKRVPTVDELVERLVKLEAIMTATLEWIGPANHRLAAAPVHPFEANAAPAPQFVKRALAALKPPPKEPT